MRFYFRLAVLLTFSQLAPHSASAQSAQPNFKPTVSKNFVYPTEALKANIQGRVFLSFSLDSTGHVQAIQVDKGLHPLLDAEAVAALQSQAPVKPALARQLRGQRFAIPVVFKLPANADQILAERYAATGLQAEPGLTIAQYPGGPAALQAFLAAAPYPEAARAQQASGRLFITITLDEAGWLKQLDAFRSPVANTATSAAAKARAEALSTLYEAAEQHFINMPQWKPAQLNGRPFSTTLTLPVTYHAVPPSTPEPVVYAYADEMPVPPAANLLAASSHHLLYPVAALRAQIQGIVWVYFVVDEQGQVTQPAIISSPHPSLEAESLKVISGLRKYTPGRHAGQPVKVGVVAPVTFVIN